MYGCQVDTSQGDWIPIPFVGVAIKVLLEGEGGVGVTVLTRMEPGSVIPRHRHARSDETVFVLTGDFIEAGVEHGPGHFFAGKAGTTHGPHETRHGCQLLTTFSADVDFITDQTD